MLWNLVLGERKREQFMLISFPLLSFGDQTSPNSILLLVGYLAFQGSSWGAWNVHRPIWVGPGFRSFRGLALSLKRKLSQLVKVRDEQMMVTTWALVTDVTFAWATPSGK